MRTFARGDPAYPTRLLALSDAPPLIHVEGVLPDPTLPSVAIVGARRASVTGVDLATRIAADLARCGVVVVSGGALGIDAAAHAGALAGGGPTVVVLPTSLEAPYPRRNRGLFRRVVDGGGACLAEHVGAVSTARWRFVVRNRLIAALADLVVVVEARARSGTASTAALATRLGRPVAAVPWRAGDDSGAGCLALLRAGARVVTSAEDVLAIVDPARRIARPTVDLTSVAGLLTARGPRTAAELAALLGRGLTDVLRELTLLELAGEVVPEVGGRYRVHG